MQTYEIIPSIATNDGKMCQKIFYTYKSVDIPRVLSYLCCELINLIIFRAIKSIKTITS
jgi:hypothetical protein